MLSKGIDVVGVDAEREALDRLQRRLMPGLKPKLIRSDFQSLQLGSNEFDIVVAGFCLFFLPPTEFDGFWTRVLGTLKREGIFLGQFLGENDEWADAMHSSHTAEEVKQLFQEFEVLSWEEVERDGETAAGRPKHWHVFHVLAKKR